MSNYVTLSLETHLFFGRIMKEHALFLLAGFPAGENRMREKADMFREAFEDGLRYVVQVSDGRVGGKVLESGEVVTEFTLRAENQTERLAGVSIDSRITEASKNLRAGRRREATKEEMRNVKMLNRHMLELVDGLIEFKEQILCKVKEGELFTANYPLLIEHIMREAKLYREVIMELENNGRITRKELMGSEMFWNQIMMEHAQFIGGLLDPVECDLIEAADGFADQYCRLLEEAKHKDCRAEEELTRKALQTTKEYQQFKAVGTDGISECRICSVILPLLADHVLREANHYLRILEQNVERER